MIRQVIRLMTATITINTINTFRVVSCIPSQSKIFGDISRAVMVFQVGGKLS
jgi:hypothetical protein